MRIVLAPVGTRGDVQPMLALGEALRDRGHSVLLCAPENFERLAGERGIEFCAGTESFETMLLPGNERAMLRRLAANTGHHFSALREACRGADVLVGAMLQFAGPSVAEALGIPYFYTVFCPAMLRSDHSMPMGVLPWRFPQPLNRVMWAMHAGLWNIFFRRRTNRERATWGLPPVRDIHRHFLESGRLLIAADPVLAPPPTRSKSAPTVTGFWYLKESGRLDAGLEAFLDAGSPPVYLGFGSMRASDPEKTTRMILEAVSANGERALIHMGWAGLARGALPASCRAVGEAPHALLFPRVSVVVHHGGAGTFAAAARAGVPQVIVAHFGDQFYWAQRARKLNLSPDWIYSKRMTARRLAAAIRTAATDGAIRSAARAVGERLRQTDGAAQAARAIEALPAGSRPADGPVWPPA